MVTCLIFAGSEEMGPIPTTFFQKGGASVSKNEENTYYTAILQNLFFATLNTEMDQPGKPPTRRFIKEVKADKESEDHMVHQVWRHAERILDRAAFERLLRSVPFLNGGLFECLDERTEKGASNYTSESAWMASPSNHPSN
jgi:hypothetical protein